MIYIKIKSHTHRGEIEITLDAKIIIFNDNLDMLENVKWWALISETYGITDSVSWLTIYAEDSVEVKIQWSFW